MADVTYVGKGAISAPAGLSTTVTLDATPAEGDLIVAFVDMPTGTSSGHSIQEVGGWTRLYEYQWNTIRMVALAIRTAGASETTSQTLTHEDTGTNRAPRVEMVVVRDSDPALLDYVTDLEPDAGTNASGTTGIFPAITTTVDGCMILQLMRRTTNTVIGTTHTPSTNWTNVAQVGAGGINASLFRTTDAVVAGAYSGHTVNLQSSTDQRYGVTVALYPFEEGGGEEPAPGGGGGGALMMVL